MTQTDKDTLIVVAQDKPMPLGSSLRVRQNFKFFDAKIAALSKADLVAAPHRVKMRATGHRLTWRPAPRTLREKTAY